MLAASLPHWGGCLDQPTHSGEISYQESFWTFALNTANDMDYWACLKRQVRVDHLAMSYMFDVDSHSSPEQNFYTITKPRKQPRKLFEIFPNVFNA